MLLLLSILIGLCSIGTILAGLLVFLRNPEKTQNKWFFAFTLSLGLWIVFNFVGSNVIQPVITPTFVKLDFSTALVMAWCFIYFVNGFIDVSQERTLYKRMSQILSRPVFFASTGALNVVLVILIFNNFFFTMSLGTGFLVVSTHSSFLVYVVVIISYLFIALRDLFLDYWHGSSSERHKLSLIVFGFTIAAAANIFTNLIFPSLSTNGALIRELNVIGYLGLLVMVLCIYVAITTRKLFDIRIFVARSLAYVLLIGTVVIFYTSLITAVGLFFVDNQTFSLRSTIASLLVALFVAVTFQYMKRFFDRVTNRLFFRDAYDTQDVLNRLNLITTTTLDLTKLLTNSSDLLKSALKANYCDFVLYRSKDEPRVVGTSNNKNNYDELVKLLRNHIKPHEELLSERLEDSSPLKQEMATNQAELIVPMHANKVLFGFAILGIKENGAIYPQRDVNLLTIATDSIAVATQNALRFEEIQEFNITLQQKIEEATRKLRQTNEKLKALDETKDEFISMASHQLRTPLTSVKGYISMVLEGDAGKINPNQKKLLDQAFVSSQRMVYLIADLLNVSRLRTGKFVIERKPTQLVDVIESEIAQLTETAKGRGLKLTFEKPETFPELMLDETKIRQVIMNFADNAIYYTQAAPDRGNIRIGLEDKGSSVEFTVTDDGIGVPKEAQHHLFTKFYRAGNAQHARPDGTGLGLFMAKKVIVAQGGALIFHSEEGKGSTFGFSFPKNQQLNVPEHLEKKP